MATPKKTKTQKEISDNNPLLNKVEMLLKTYNDYRKVYEEVVPNVMNDAIETLKKYDSKEGDFSEEEIDEIIDASKDSIALKKSYELDLSLILSSFMDTVEDAILLELPVSEEANQLYASIAPMKQKTQFVVDGGKLVPKDTTLLDNIKKMLRTVEVKQLLKDLARMAPQQ